MACIMVVKVKYCGSHQKYNERQVSCFYDLFKIFL